MRKWTREKIYKTIVQRITVIIVQAEGDAIC